MGKTFYEQLNVPGSASQDVILDAYLARVREAHPDFKVNSDHHKVRDLYIAYSVLSDPEERQRYDLALSNDLCLWCDQPTAATDLEHHLGEHAAPDARGGCIVCGRLPARRFEYRASAGLLLWRKTDLVDGNLCKTCATGVFRAMQARNLSRGPWGIISVFAAPYHLLRNWLAHRKAGSLPGPEPHDPIYDDETGPGRTVWRRPPVLISLLAIATVVVFATQVVVNDGQVVADAEVEGVTSTTIDPHDGWVVGGCAGFDTAGRVFPTDCGDHFATVVGFAPTESECPENTEWSVGVTEGVACFEET